MALIQQLLAISPFLLACVSPLLIIACLMLASGEWFDRKWRTAVLIYCLSWIALPLADYITNWADAELVLVSGIAVPLVCGLLFALHGAIRFLHLPPAHRLHFSSYHSASNGFGRIGKGVIGGCVGCILGATVGITLSLLLLALFSLMALLPQFSLLDRSPLAAVALVVDTGVYPCMLLGLSLGVAIGSGILHWRQLTDRLLISAVIYSAVVSLQFKKLLRISIIRQLWQRLHSARISASSGALVTAHSLPNPVVSLPSPYAAHCEVTEVENRLRLRHRTYRSGDWVWMGFNGLYDGFALLIGSIALLRGTWITMGLSVGLILLLGVVWTWHTLASLCNYTTITLGEHGLTRQDIPLFSWIMPLHIPLNQLIAVKAATIQRPGRSALQTMPEYRVTALLVGGRHVSLLRHLEHWEEAEFIENQVNRFQAKLNT